MVVREVLRDGASEEEDDNNGCRDPKWSIKIRISVKYVKKVGSGI